MVTGSVGGDELPAWATCSTWAMMRIMSHVTYINIQDRWTKEASPKDTERVGKRPNTF